MKNATTKPAGICRESANTARASLSTSDCKPDAATQMEDLHRDLARSLEQLRETARRLSRKLATIRTHLHGPVPVESEAEYGDVPEHLGGVANAIENCAAGLHETLNDLDRIA